MKRLFVVLTAITAFCLSGCNGDDDGSRAITNRKILSFAPVIHDQKDMQRVVDALKTNTVFYEIDGVCFAAIFYWTGDHYNSVSITQVTKCPK